MLRHLFDYQLSLTEKGKPLEKIKPLITATDTFFYEAPINTTRGPHIRDAIDIKRWMLIVVFALIPCILMAIWNTGLQDFVYSSGDYKLMNEYLAGASSFRWLLCLRRQRQSLPHYPERRVLCLHAHRHHHLCRRRPLRRALRLRARP